MKLSICVVTMNRAQQLADALHSCLECVLSDETEFVIIDNASTDNTEQIVKATLGNSGYNYYYEKLSKNLGVGGGRNYAYSRSKGEFVYMLDDDAVIDNEKCSNFFKKAVQIFEETPDVVTLTSQIYDTVWKKNRVNVSGGVISEGVYKHLMFCGGSHFLRKEFFKQEPYLSNKYGYEEIPPSLRAINAKKINAFCPDLLVEHRPAENKWNWNEAENVPLLIKGYALPYAIKKMMYPDIMTPILKLANKRRIKKYLSNLDDAEKMINQKADEFCKEYPISEKIKFSTVCRMFCDFKLSIF